MARSRSKARSTRNGKNNLKPREHRDEQGSVQPPKTKYKGSEASQSGEPQKRRRSHSLSKRPSDQSDQSSNLGAADRLSSPKTNLVQPGSEGSPRNGKNSLDSCEVSQSGEPHKPARSSSTLSKPSSDQSDQSSKFGNLAQSILADGPGLLLAAAAAAGTFLISRWLGENRWLRRSFGRRDGQSFIPGGSWGQAHLLPNRNESNTQPAQHWGIDRGDIDSESSFEVGRASQEDLVAQAGDQSDHVEGTEVFNLNGQQIGRISRLMIAKVGGQVLYAIMELEDLAGNGTDEYAIPWSKLEYDTTLEGYRTDITQEELQNAPEFSRDQNLDWAGQQSQRDLPRYFEVPITGLRPDGLGSVPRSSS